MKSFLTCFYILDYCYFINYENDLGGILGVMSPDLLADGKPIDTAVLEYWKKVCPDNPSSDVEIINKVYDFLEFYEDNFGFNFEKTRELIKTSEILSYVETAKTKADKTCKEHNY